MESFCTARDRSTQAIRDRLLPERVASLRRCSSLARRVLSHSSVAASSKTRTSTQGNKPAANYDPDLEAIQPIIKHKLLSPASDTSDHGYYFDGDGIRALRRIEASQRLRRRFRRYQDHSRSNRSFGKITLRHRMNDGGKDSDVAKKTGPMRRF